MNTIEINEKELHMLQWALALTRADCYDAMAKGYYSNEDCSADLEIINSLVYKIKSALKEY